MFGGEIHFLRENLIERLFLRIFGSWHTGARIRAFHILRLAARYLKGGCHILDAGCGLGRHAFFIARKYPNSSIIGIDSNEDNISLCNGIRERNSLKTVRFQEGDLRSLDFGQHFDLIICSDVLEYIEEDTKALTNFRKALKKNGTLILHTPRANPRRYLHQFEKYLKSDPVEKLAHAREGYTGPQLRQKLRENGLMITDLRYTFGYFGLLSWELSKILERVKPLFVLCFPLILFLGYIDSLKTNREGNGILIEAQRVKAYLI